MAMRIDGVQQALSNWMEHPPGGDEFIRAHAEALSDDLTQHGRMYDFFAEWFTAHPQVGSSHAISKLLRAVQSQLLTNFDSYPDAFLSAAQWQKGFDWILDDPDRAGQLLVDVWTRPLQSNKSERYKSLKAFAVAARHLGRLGLFDVLDIGCSQNVGLNHIASEIGFRTPTVIRPGSQRRLPGLEYTAAFNRLLHEQLPLYRGVGVDLTSPADSRDWAWSCSHYPSELLDRERVELFRALIMAEYGNVGFFRGDFADFDDQSFQEEYENNQFDIVHFSTVLYQATEAQREAMLTRAGRYAKEFVVVQDFLKIDPNDPAHLLFRDDWQDEPYPYRMVMRDMRAENPHQWHELFLWNDGRCREMAFGIGRVALGQHQTASVWSVFKQAARNEL